jgi:transcriptional regulator with XRE-family HTH domain
MNDQAFGQWLKEQRQASNLTLRKLAEQLDVKHPYLSQIENGLAMPSEELARKIAALFGADPEEIVFRAREVAQTIDHIREKFPKQAAAYFRRVRDDE